MSRFIMARRRQSLLKARESGKDGFEVRKIIDSLGKKVRAVEHDQVNEQDEGIFILHADSGDLESEAKNYPEVWIEPEIIHWPQNHTNYTVTVQSGGFGLEATQVHFLTGDGNTGRYGPMMCLTDANGVARIPIPTTMPVSLVVASPVSGHWEMAVNPSINLQIDCQEFMFPANGLDWWHRYLGIEEHDPHRGQGIRIGVVDTGVGPHEALRHVKGAGAWLDDGFDDDVDDVEIHGSHVCGILGARPGEAGGYHGIVPGSEIFAVRAFRGTKGTTNRAIRNAVKALSNTHHVDLINLSVTSERQSDIVIEAIEAARDEGCLTIAAAGNTHDEIMWPSRSDSVVAVTAVGLESSGYPAGSMAAYSVPSKTQHLAGNGLIFAEFSCHGFKRGKCCAPGVGIISTIPARALSERYSWAAMGGTSMATPMVTGVLAALLAKDQKYLRSTGKDRADRAEEVLYAACVPNALDVRRQGYGMPNIS